LRGTPLRLEFRTGQNPFVDSDKGKKKKWRTLFI
jgi:GTP-binding protein